MKKNKNFFKRIGALVCALVVAVSAMGVGVPYYASDDLSIKRYERMKSAFLQYDLDLSMYNIRDDYYYICSYDFNSGIVFFYGVHKDDVGECVVVKYNFGSYVNQSYTIDLAHRNRFEQESDYWDYNYVDVFSDSIRTNRDSSSLVPYGQDYIILYSDLDIYNWYGVKEPLDEDDLYYSAIPYLNNGEFYNSSFGYLQNITCKTLYLDDEEGHKDLNTLRYVYSYDALSTTGIELTNGEYSVRHYLKYVVRDSAKKIVREYDLALCDVYDATNLKIVFDVYTTRENYENMQGVEPLSWWESGVLGYELYVYDYLQIVRTNEDGSIEYGGYVSLCDNADTLDENMFEDTNGYIDKDIPSSSGSGSSYDNAENDANNNISNSGSLNEMESILNDYASTLGSIPIVVANIFGFMPSWCLGVVALSFSFLVILIVYKLVRG